MILVPHGIVCRPPCKCRSYSARPTGSLRSGDLRVETQIGDFAYQDLLVDGFD
jgi:hypothetical protein